MPHDPYAELDEMQQWRFLLLILPAGTYIM